MDRVSVVVHLSCIVHGMPWRSDPLMVLTIAVKESYYKGRCKGVFVFKVMRAVGEPIKYSVYDAIKNIMRMISLNLQINRFAVFPVSLWRACPAMATSNKQQATSNKQQATSNKQQATSNKQQATSNKQQATSNKQQATSNKQQATSNKQQATSNKQQASTQVTRIQVTNT